MEATIGLALVLRVWEFRVQGLGPRFWEGRLINGKSILQWRFIVGSMSHLQRDVGLCEQMQALG